MVVAGSSGQPGVQKRGRADSNKAAIDDAWTLPPPRITPTRPDPEAVTYKDRCGAARVVPSPSALRARPPARRPAAAGHGVPVQRYGVNTQSRGAATHRAWGVAQMTGTAPEAAASAREPGPSTPAAQAPGPDPGRRHDDHPLRLHRPAEGADEAEQRARPKVAPRQARARELGHGRAREIGIGDGGARSDAERRA